MVELRLDGVEALAAGLGEPRVAWRWILDVEQFLREAVEVVDRLRLFHRGHRGAARVPVRRDAQDRLGSWNGLAEFPPSLGVLVALKGIHRAAVPEKHRRHSGAGFRHREPYARSNNRTSASSPFSSAISEVLVAFSASPASSGWPFAVSLPPATCR